MDYEEFTNEWKKFEDWEEEQEPLKNVTRPRSHTFRIVDEPDRVNSPSHYMSGKQAVIDTIEDAVKDAPNPVLGGLQWNVLKYMLRVWLKDNPLEDLKKARWYLNRLIEKMEERLQ
jgi:hypothetical protein